MPDTGAPWNIPYVESTDLVSDWPTDSLALADAIADGLDGAGGTKQVVIAEYGTRTSTSGTNAYSDIFTLDITPKSATSTLILICQMPMAYNTNATAGGGALDIAESGSSLSHTVSIGSRTAGFNKTNFSGLNQGARTMETAVGIVSTPSTGTSLRTFAARVYQDGVTSVQINRPVTDGGTASDVSGASSMICFEVA